MSALTGTRAGLCLWVGRLVSGMGSSLDAFAIAIWVNQSGGSATAYSQVWGTCMLAAVAVLPMAGVVADRCDRRRLLLLGDAVCCAVTLAMALTFRRIALWHLCLLLTVLSASATLTGTTLSAMVPSLAPGRQLGRANGLLQFNRAAAAVFGPALASALLPVVGLGGLMALDSGSFAAGLISTLSVAKGTGVGVRPASRPTPWRDLVAGWRHVRSHQGLLPVLLVCMAANTLLGMMSVLTAPLVLSFASQTTLGVLYALGGSGMVAGSVGVAVAGVPRARVRGLLLAMAISGLAAAVAGVRPSAVLIGAAAPVFYAALQVINATLMALIQSRASAGTEGRLLSFVALITVGTMPLAFAAGGPLADHVFEPCLAPGGALAPSLGAVIGVGRGRGIGCMFLFSGLAVFATSVAGFFWRSLMRLESTPAGHPPVLQTSDLC